MAEEEIRARLKIYLRLKLKLKLKLLEDLIYLKQVEHPSLEVYNLIKDITETL